MDDLAMLLPTSKATWLLIVAGVTTLAFALSAFASDRLGHTIVSPFLAAGAWLFGAFAVLVWFLGVSGLVQIRVGVSQGLPKRRVTMTRWNGVTVEAHKLKWAIIASSQ